MLRVSLWGAKQESDIGTTRAVINISRPDHVNKCNPMTVSARLPKDFQLEHVTIVGVNASNMFCEVMANGIATFGKPAPVELFAENCVWASIDCEPWPKDARIDVRIGPEPYCKMVV